jgi:5-methylcytosine-specific restriction protein B
LKKRFNKLKELGQIEFVTFHQSYGYEEFVEGIKAESDESGNLSYIIEDGIFKEISKRAEENWKNWKNSINEIIKKDFYEILKEKLIIPLEENERIEIPLKIKKNLYL